MGPVNRDHSFNLNKKEKKLALKSALSVKLNEDKVFIIDSFEIKSFKTKELISDLKQFDCNSALFIYSSDGLNKNFKLASSNIPKVSTLNQKGVNVKDLITYDKIFMNKNLYRNNKEAFMSKNLKISLEPSILLKNHHDRKIY